MNNVINNENLKYKNKYLKYKNKYLELNYVGGSVFAPSNFKTKKWDKFEQNNKNKFILFFNLEAFTNIENVTYSFSNLLDTYIKYITSSPNNDTKVEFILDEQLIFNNLSLFKYKLGETSISTYKDGKIIPWVKLHNYNFNSVEKISNIPKIRLEFLKTYNDITTKYNNIVLPVSQNNLLKIYNFNNFEIIILKILEDINTLLPNIKSNITDIINITNNYNKMTTRQVTLNGITPPPQIIGTLIIHDVINSSIVPLTNWMMISNVKSDAQNHCFKFYINGLDSRLLQSQ